MAKMMHKIYNLYKLMYRFYRYGNEKNGTGLKCLVQNLNSN